MSEIRIADLFAGIGGIRMGMVQALGDAAHVVYSSEWNKYSVQTYEATLTRSLRSTPPCATGA